MEDIAYDKYVEEDEPPVYLYRKEFRVTSAITISELLSYKDGICEPDLKQWFDKYALNYDINNTYNYQQFIFNQFFNRCNKSLKISNIIIRAMSDVINISTVDWCNLNYNINYSVLNDCPFLLKINYLRHYFDRVICRFRANSEKEIYFKSNELSLTFISHGDWLYVESCKGHRLVIPWLAMVAIQDSLIGLSDILIYSIINDLCVGTSLTTKLIDIVNMVIESLILLGKDIYSVLKAWLPATVGNILNNENSPYINDLYDSVMKGMHECKLKEYLSIPLKTLDSRFEGIKFAGINKVFTYPIVEIESAVNNVINIASKFRPISVELQEESVCMFRKIWIRNYLRKHKVWPKVSYDDKINPHILNCILSNTWGEKADEWDPIMFKHITFEQNMDFNYFIDSSELLSDKAIASGLKYWPQEYDRRYHYLKYGRPCKAGAIQSKRVIIKHLKTPVVNVKDSILRVLKEPMFGNLKMFVLCIKERELSQEKARYFTKLPNDVRLYQTCIAANIKRVNRYFPYQSMTMSGLSLSKMKVKLSSTNTLKISLDFSKWCLHQTHQINNKIAKDMDRILGTPGLIESSHIFPQESFCFFQDRTNIPEQAPDGLPYIGSRVTFGLGTLGEGMYQDLWTPSSGCKVLVRLRRLGYKVRIMATGDNFIIVVDLPKDKEPLLVQMEIFNELQEMSEEIGLPLKLEETFCSNQYFEYGKDSYIRGKRVGAGLKKASRIGTETQETLPSLNNRLSSIFSTGVASAGEDFLPIPAYSVCLFESMLSILEIHPNLDHYHLASMLLISRSLGGLKVSNYYSFCVRGVIDHPTWNLHLLQTIKQSKDKYPQLYRHILSSRINLARFNKQAVIKDPYAISFNTPKDGEFWLRDIISDELYDFTENKFIKPLFSLDASKLENMLIDDLLTLHPPSLKLMSCIYQYSNVALKERAIGRFASSTSVNNLVQTKYSMVQLYNNVRQNDIDLVKFYADRGKNSIFKQLLEEDECPTILMTRLRKQITGLDLITPSAPPITHQIRFKKWSDISEKDLPKSIKIEVADSIKEYLFSKGPYRAYLGSDTHVKRSKTSMELINPDTIDRSALSLAELSSWVGNDTQLQHLIDTLIREKTTTDPELIKTSARQIVGGTFEHRGQLMILPMGAFINYDPNIMSHIEVITDTATAFAKKQKDYTIMFQLIKVTIGSYFLHLHAAGIDVVGEWACILDCNGCTTEIYDGDFSIPNIVNYSGLDLGIRSDIQFQNTSTMSHGIFSDPLEGAHAYLGEELAMTLLDWTRYEQVLETDVIDKMSLVHNYDINLSEISRCSLDKLLSYLFGTIFLHSSILDDLMKLEYSVDKYIINPAEVIINTLIMAGHGRRLLTMIPYGSSLRLSNSYNRFKFFLSLWQTRHEELISKIQSVLPTDSPQYILLVACMKRKMLGENLESDLLMSSNLNDDDKVRLAMVRCDLKVAPPKDICIKELRKRPNVYQDEKLCTLPNTLIGNIDLALGTACNSFVPTLGLNVASSQIWSFQDALPHLPALTIEDSLGSIGVILGHRGIKSYINDTSTRESLLIRINNGPEALYYDECITSYDRDYYIANLNQELPQRPVNCDNLIIVSKKDIRNTKYSYLYRDGDYLLCRDITTGYPLVGLPRRSINDIWYLWHNEEYEVAPYELETPLYNLTQLYTGVLSPMKRLELLTGLEDLSGDKVKIFLEIYISTWLDTRRRGITHDYINMPGLKRRKIRNKNIDEYLSMVWLKSVIWEEKPKKMRWHIDETGDIHTYCQCKTKKSIFIYRDELLVYLVKML